MGPRCVLASGSSGQALAPFMEGQVARQQVPRLPSCGALGCDRVPHSRAVAGGQWLAELLTAEQGLALCGPGALEPLEPQGRPLLTRPPKAAGL